MATNRSVQLVAIVALLATACLCTSTPRAPIFKWAQDLEKVYITIPAKGMANAKKDISDGRNVHFKYTLGDAEEAYQLDLELLKDFDPQKSKVFTKKKEAYIELVKSKAQFWDRLLKTTEKMPNMKVDWDRYREEPEVSSFEEKKQRIREKRKVKEGKGAGMGKVKQETIDGFERAGLGEYGVEPSGDGKTFNKRSPTNNAAFHAFAAVMEAADRYFDLQFFNHLPYIAKLLNENWIFVIPINLIFLLASALLCRSMCREQREWHNRYASEAAEKERQKEAEQEKFEEIQQQRRPIVQPKPRQRILPDDDLPFKPLFKGGK